jgi:glycogen operon protein
MINAWWRPIRFHIQEGAAGKWKRVVDTSRASPDDIADQGNEWPIESLDYEVAPRSVVVLEST